MAEHSEARPARSQHDTKELFVAGIIRSTMMIVTLLVLTLANQTVEAIPHVRRSAGPVDYQLTMASRCPSGLEISIRRYAFSLPRGGRTVILVNGRTLRGVDAARLSEDLSHPDAIYRFHPSCDRDRRRAWLSIDIAKPNGPEAISYSAASLFIDDGRLVAYNPPRSVPAQSFWQGGSREEQAVDRR